MKFFNTLTRKKDDFEPLEGNTVRIYSCGPTVYNYAHIGNLRAYLFMDLLRRGLRYNGYDLKHVMNITDVGHLVSDADTGEDKMEKAAREQKKDPYEIAAFYTKEFFADFERLNIEKPEIIAKATDHIAEMEKYVQEIMENGYAYETGNGVYFDISKLDRYGILSGTNTEEQMAGARIEVDSEKRNPLDFALWIKAPENHIMKWDSQWGKCYPGWHIECSAMGRKYLGDVFDIHTGGEDHIPIHHENEIAQAKGATGKIPAKFWMHVAFLTVDGGKMSKSLGNCYRIAELQEKGFEPLAYRYFCLNSHYKSKLNFTFDALKGAQTSLNRLREGIKQHALGNDSAEKEEIAQYKEQFREAINDDLNSPKALAILWEVVRKEKKSKDYLDLILDFDRVLGLDLDIEKIKKLEESKEDSMSDEVKALIEQRNQARAEKNWAEADRIRDLLNQMGIQINDKKA
ncbi:MAG: cysteine--tRNA ligase [Clostridia bacterium]|nr:cysteine--tRNA ligase [Clostridia bacterium]